MTHDEAIKTAREAFSELISIVKIHSRNTDNNFAWAELPDAEEALAAFDSLAMEPTEDQGNLIPMRPWVPAKKKPSDNVRQFRDKIIYLLGMAEESRIPDMYMEDINKLITARDERIRRECESKSNSIISDLLDVFDALNGKKYMTADRGRKIIDNARASIMGEAKK